MKNYKLLLAMSVIALFLAGCGISKMVKTYPNVNIKLENQDLENKGGKVDYTVKGNIPPKYLKKKAAMEIEVPVLTYDQNGTVINEKKETITLVGEKSKVSGIKIPYKNGGSFSKTGSFDYTEAYENATINAISTVTLGKKSYTFDARNIGEGISNTSSLIKIDPELADINLDSKSVNATRLLYAPHNYKPEFTTVSAIIYFEVNKSDMNWNLKLNKDAAAKTAIKDFVASLFEGRTIDKVIISGWASPEGEESNNQGLSEKRFEQGKKWFAKEFDKYLKDYAKKNKIKMKDLVKPELVFENNTKGEDWDGFEVAVEKSNIAEKSKILNIVRSQSNNDMREQKIREMTDIYTEIKDAILPPLRRAEISMVFNKNNFNDEQIARLINLNPDTLTLNERLYAATMTDDVNKKEAIYSAIIADESVQNDWRAYNNSAILSINNYISSNHDNYLTEAINDLNKANAISPGNGIILNNLAIANFYKGDLAAAKAKFQESAKASLFPVNQDYNLGMFKILEGDYAAAKSMMNDKHCDYNAALAQLVSKDYASAKTTLDCIPNKDAKVYYLKAVLAARTNNEAQVYADLKIAVEKSPALGAKALKDPEFKKFRKNDEFKNIVK